MKGIPKPDLESYYEYGWNNQIMKGVSLNQIWKAIMSMDETAILWRESLNQIWKATLSVTEKAKSWREYH
jgi:hypothetical protein